MHIKVLVVATALVWLAELGLARLVWVPLKVHMILIIFFISHLLKHLILFGVII